MARCIWCMDAGRGSVSALAFGFDVVLFFSSVFCIFGSASYRVCDVIQHDFFHQSDGFWILFFRVSEPIHHGTHFHARDGNVRGIRRHSSVSFPSFLSMSSFLRFVSTFHVRSFASTPDRIRSSCIFSRSAFASDPIFFLFFSPFFSFAVGGVFFSRDPSSAPLLLRHGSHGACVCTHAPKHRNVTHVLASKGRGLDLRRGTHRPLPFHCRWMVDESIPSRAIHKENEPTPAHTKTTTQEQQDRNKPRETT